MFLAEIRKNNVYPSKPQFYYINMRVNGSKLYRHVFVMRFQEGIALQECMQEVTKAVFLVQMAEDLQNISIHLKQNKITFPCNDCDSVHTIRGK